MVRAAAACCAALYPLAVAGGAFGDAEQAQATLISYPWNDTEWDQYVGKNVFNQDTYIKIGDPIKARNQWACGNSPIYAHHDLDEVITAGKWTNWNKRGNVANASINTRAGIQLLKGEEGKKSLDWVKATEATVMSAADLSSGWWGMGTDQLFCGSYIRRYKNPRTRAGDAAGTLADASDYAGVCIRDNTPGYRWKSIVQADREAKNYWERFGNIRGNANTPLKAEHAGYQRGNAIARNTTANSWNYRWGSGAIGDIPNNWCESYFREMLCHVAFPQYAGPAPTAAADIANFLGGCTDGTPCTGQATGTHTNWNLMTASGSDTMRPTDFTMNTWDSTQGNRFFSYIRPVCSEWCANIFDLCNRHEPVYDTEKAVPAGDYPWAWIQPDYKGEGLLHGRTLQPNLGVGGRIAPGENAYGDFGSTSGWVSADKCESSRPCPRPDQYGMSSPSCCLRKMGEEGSGFWCKAWNLGYGLAQAGTGVGTGPDQDVGGPEDSSRFCAKWEAGGRHLPSAVVTMLLAATAAAVALLA